MLREVELYWKNLDTLMMHEQRPVHRIVHPAYKSFIDFCRIAHNYTTVRQKEVNSVKKLGRSENFKLTLTLTLVRP